MRSVTDFLRQCCAVGWEMTRTGAVSVGSHWALALFSLVAAFGVWMAIQDVENPLAQGIAPASGAIPVEAVNVPDGYLVDTIPPVTVRVETREELLANLTAADFIARVDVSGVSTDGIATTRPLRVSSRIDGVKILDQPADVRVQLLKASTKEVPVTVNQTSPLPQDYREKERRLDPAVVTVVGRPELVDTVVSVQIDVPLAGVRQETYRYKGQLTARTASGNTVDVQLSQSEATAEFRIEPITSTRTIAVIPKVTGALPAGYRLGAITADPLTVVVTGPKASIESLGAVLYTNPVDISGARQDVVKPNVAIEHPENVSVVDRPEGVVTVKVVVVAAECGNNNTTVCDAQTVVVAPRFTDVPAGLSLADAVYQVQVRVSGPVASVRALKPGDIQAEISLAGAASGAAAFVAKITGPEDLRFEADPVTISLNPVTLP